MQNQLKIIEKNNYILIKINAKSTKNNRKK